MRYLSVCSGIEAATVAWHRLGWEPVGFSEIEPFPSAVLAHHYPHVPNFGDMTKFQEWPLDAGSIDLLVAGTPCQSFSVAGLRQGLKDPRGNLMLTYLAIAARLRPRWVVWENVPGVLSSNGGLDFGSLLGGLVQLGYGVSYRVLDAQWVRTHGHPNAQPQRRRRVFVVGCLADSTAAAKVLFERESVQRHSKKSGAAGQEATSDVEGRVGAGCWWDGGNTSDTLTKCGANGAQRMPDKDNFGAVLQPTAATEVSDTLVAQNNQTTGFQTDIVATPTAFDRQTQGSYGVGNVASTCAARDFKSATDLVAVPYTKSKRAQSDTDDETWVEGQVNPTLSLFDCGDVRATTAIAIPILPQAMQAEGWRVGKENKDGRGNGLGVGENGDPCPTLDRSAVPAVAIQGSMIGRQDHNGPGGSGCSSGGEMFTLTSTDTHAVAQAMTVRRLTPRECERLQGFPDDYTLIPWRKKAADDCPDGPRYKALGNSMAVNCMEWIGERIAAFEAEKETT